MKKLKSSNKNFYDDLSTHLKKRSQQNIQTIDFWLIIDKSGGSEHSGLSSGQYRAQDSHCARGQSLSTVH